MMNLEEALKHVKEPFSGDKGLYVSVVPDERSRKIFHLIAHYLNLETDASLYHATLMYSPKQAPETYDVSGVPKVFKAKIDGIEFFDEGTHCVVTVKSPTLQTEHKRLTELGAKHTFTPYTPHVTISGNAKDKVLAKDLKIVLDLVKGLEVSFIDYNWSNLVKD